MATDNQRNAQSTTRVDQQCRYFSERQRRIYEYVRNHEPVARERLVYRSDSVTDQRAAVHHCVALKRLGILTADGNRLRIGFDVATLPDPETVTARSVNGDVTIRPVGWRGYTDLCERLQQNDGENPDVETEQISRRVATEGRLFRQDRVRERVAYAAYTATEMRGWVLLSSSRPQDKHTVTLTSGVVETSGGDVSLGSRLREYGLKWARSRGYGKVYRPLPATKQGTIETLESDGWTVDARREGRYRTEAGLVDEVVLAWRFDDGFESDS
ncbi:hypothetical protein [Natrinema halophilum]|uniref:hypothetical protein n=1 Tax=Natrinema halophilum TaxID=1699371 RepID=UPI001F2A0D51|nr:hypothetical protein [Natrinema halophilum]UHQ96174.1 hypothetical protein HYG82_22915 [Natrinema halophilum]